MFKFINEKKFFFIFLFLTTSCISKYQDFTIKTETKLVAPLAFGEYKLGDLFYDLEDADELVLNTGTFFQINDTIPYNNSTFSKKIDSAELKFRANNIMPFQVDLQIIPFDTISKNRTGDALYITIVEAAEYEESVFSLNSVQTEYSLLLNDDLIEIMKQSNGLLIDAVFIWPYEKVLTSIIDDLYEFEAFNLKVILEVNIKM